MQKPQEESIAKLISPHPDPQHFVFWGEFTGDQETKAKQTAKEVAAAGLARERPCQP